MTFIPGKDLGLTAMALLSMQADLDYAEYLKEEMKS